MKYEIRLANEPDIEHLPTIEQAASALFTDTEFAAETSQACLDVEFLIDCLRGGNLWVAIYDDKPVGFAVMTEIDGNAHLHELSVHPSHQRKGLGRDLVNVVCETARENGFATVSLSTYTEVPWNAPFYSSLGFRSMDRYGRGYQDLREEEAAAGLNVTKRTIMFLAL
jgi:GNAT superfamily N-acetyltransferase